MSMAAENFIHEARKLLDLIDVNLIKKQEDYLFVESIRNRVKVGAFVNRKQIHWLRDIKDRQLES